MSETSYSLLTTKRKFHRLLDSISNNGLPTEELASSQDVSTPATLGATNAQERPVKRLRPLPKQRSEFVSASPRLSLLLTQQALRSKQRDEEVASIHVTYKPFDKAAFLKRLSTFSRPNPGSWKTKPDDISEVAWAMRGWKLLRTEVVACVSCYKALEINLERSGKENGMAENGDGASLADSHDIEVSVAVEQELTLRYKNLIVEGHASGCPWRIKGCHKSIYQIDMTSSSEVLQQLVDRFLDLTKDLSSLPRRIAVPQHERLEELYQEVSFLYPSVNIEASEISNDKDPASHSQSSDIESTLADPEPADVRYRALAMGLAGWRLLRDSEATYAGATWECDYCFRRFGIYLLQPRAIGNEILEPLMSEFDVMREHREYCPWVNGSSQVPESAAETPGAVAQNAFEQLINRLTTQYLTRAVLKGYSTKGTTHATILPSNTDEERRKKLSGIRKLFSKLKPVKKDGNGSLKGQAGS